MLIYNYGFIYQGVEIASIAKHGFINESTAGADASVEARYNVAFKKKPGDRSSDSCSYNVQLIAS